MVLRVELSGEHKFIPLVIKQLCCDSNRIVLCTEYNFSAMCKRGWGERECERGWGGEPSLQAKDSLLESGNTNLNKYVKNNLF